MGCNFSSIASSSNVQSVEVFKPNEIFEKVALSTATTFPVSTANTSVVLAPSPKALSSLPTETKPSTGSMRNIYTNSNFSTAVSKLETIKRVPLDKQTLKELMSLNIARFCKGKEYVLNPKGEFDRDYVKMEMIGKGGEAEAYKVFHRPTNQTRVAKIVSKTSIKQDMKKIKIAEERLLKEAEILSRMDHPNIVKVHEVLQDKHQTAVIMEHLGGGNLLEYINNPAFQTYEAIATMMGQLLSALAYIHSKGIIHKDIKLENILFEEKGSFVGLKLIDFGFSEDKNKPYTPSSSGTLMYMAPEVFGLNYNEKVDIWSVGVLLHMLLFKENPFKGRTNEAIIEDIVNKDIKTIFLNPKVKNVDHIIISFLKRLLERDIHKRISASEALRENFIVKYAYRPAILPNDITLLKNYNSKSALEFVLSAIYVHCLMSNEEKSELVRVFRALDIHKEGFINVNDLKKLDQATYKEQSRNTRAAKGHKFGQLTVSNFMIACMDIQDRDTLRKLFVYFDQDGDMMVKIADIFAIMDTYTEKTILEDIKYHIKSVKEQEEISYWNFDQIIKLL